MRIEPISQNKNDATYLNYPSYNLYNNINIEGGQGLVNMYQTLWVRILQENYLKI